MPGVLQGDRIRLRCPQPADRDERRRLGRDALRCPQPADRDERRRLGRDAEIVRMFGGDTAAALAPLEEVEIQRWYSEMESEQHGWMIEHDGRFIGTARLHSVNMHDRRARYAVGILDRALLGRGLGTEVTDLVLRYAFNQLGLHRVDLRVLAFNERAIRSYEKSGFRREGVERESALIDGTWYDDVMMFGWNPNFGGEKRRGATRGDAPRRADAR